MGRLVWPGREVGGKEDENAEVCPPVSGMLGGQPEIRVKGGARESHGWRPEGPVFYVPGVSYSLARRNLKSGMAVPRAQL